MEENTLKNQQITDRYPPRYRRVLIDISLGYLLISVVIGLNLALARYNIKIGARIPIMVLSGILNTCLIHYLYLFLHEAAHYNFLPGKDLNDRWANPLLAFWFAHDIELFRKMHWEHHCSHGSKRDPDNSYFSPLNLKNLAGALVKFSFFKVAVLNALTNPSKAKPRDDVDRRKRRAIIFFVVYNIVILSIFLNNNAYLQYLLLWFLPMFSGFPLFSYIRQVCEHRKFGVGNRVFGEEEHGPYTRIFKNTLFSCFLGGAGFRYHWHHHFNPYISYTRLGEFAEEVKKAAPKLTEEINETTYLETFYKLFHEADIAA